MHKLPAADLYRWSWGRWRVSKSVLHSLATDTAGSNQLCPIMNGMIAKSLKE